MLFDEHQACDSRWPQIVADDFVSDTSECLGKLIKGLSDEAIHAGWTRKQFIEEFNNPEHFQIEDAPGNYGHRFEVPRAR